MFETEQLSYEESSAAQYDPIKPRVIGALSKALTKSDLQDLKLIQESETTLGNSWRYPYEPDLVIGYNGQKLGIFVLNDIDVMRDSQSPDGESIKKMKLIEQFHRQGQGAPIKTVALPISKVVDYDLKNYKLSLNNDFNLMEFLKESTSGQNFIELNIEGINQLAYSLISQMRDSSGMSTQLEEFIQQAVILMQSRNKLDALYETEQLVSSYDELKFQILKLKMIHDSKLSDFDRQVV